MNEMGAVCITSSCPKFNGRNFGSIHSKYGLGGNGGRAMGVVRIMSLYPKFNGSHFDWTPSSVHTMTGWVAISRML